MCKTKVALWYLQEQKRKRCVPCALTTTPRERSFRGESSIPSGDPSQSPLLRCRSTPSLVGTILHAGAGLVLGVLDAVAEQLLTMLSLLVLLDQTAAAAAARKQQVGDAVALEVVLLAHILTLHG